ncbi:hypothetical protein HY411_01995 [Candidatus Gottesmanbacteria bacterium]|nr:hypothetical protein [Candidatus Gottesmanbacteria bacterium]
MNTRSIALVLILLFFVVSSPSLSFAATSPKPQPTVTLTSEPVGKAGITMEKKPEYLLPFPGILPDHPLYFLKQVRDGILDRLIVDPLRKAEFHILQADKRLNMGRMLVEQTKGTLAEMTISKGEKYTERAISGLSAFKSTGRPVPASIIDRLTRSMEKHVEVLNELIAKTSGPQKTGLTGSLEFIKKLQGEVERLK